MIRGFRVGRLAGVDVDADWSLGVLGVLLTWSIWANFAAELPDVHSRTIAIVALAGGFLFFTSILVHELSHSVIAIRRGLPVLRIRLFIFGGVSEIDGEAANADDELAIALAGPVASILLGAGFLGLAWLFPASWTAIDRLLRLLGIGNLILAVFNLLPGFPLDGGRVMRALLWRIRKDKMRATEAATVVGRILGLLLVGLGAFSSFRPGGILAGVWYVAIGVFLYQAAAGALARERFLERIDGVTIADVMRATPEAVPGTIPVSTLVDHYQVGPRLRTYPVEVDGRVRGIIGDVEVKALSEEERRTRLVATAMTPIGPADVVEGESLLEDLLSRDAGPARRVVVVRNGRVIGIVAGEDLGHLFSR